MIDHHLTAIIKLKIIAIACCVRPPTILILNNGVTVDDAEFDGVFAVKADVAILLGCKKDKFWQPLRIITADQVRIGDTRKSPPKRA